MEEVERESKQSTVWSLVYKGFNYIHKGESLMAPQPLRVPLLNNITLADLTFEFEKGYTHIRADFNNIWSQSNFSPDFCVISLFTLEVKD